VEQHEELLGMQFFIPGLPEKKRNNRRKATEIARMFTCPVEGCHKSYGYESTLKHHLKIKHGGVEPVSKNQLSHEKTVQNTNAPGKVFEDFQVPTKLPAKTGLSRSATGESESVINASPPVVQD